MFKGVYDIMCATYLWSLAANLHTKYRKIDSQVKQGWLSKALFRVMLQR